MTPKNLFHLFKAWGRKLCSERANASIEFIGWSLIVVIPLLYLVIALADIQAAAFATTAAVDSAARVLEVDNTSQAFAHAQSAADWALADQHVSPAGTPALQLTCADGKCAHVVVKVETGVSLPLLEGLVGKVVFLDDVRVVAPLSAQIGANSGA